MATDEPTVVVVGAYNQGLTVTVPQLPVPGETVLGTEYMEGPGGKGSNQAVAAARLGVTAQFVGRIGDDRFGTAAGELWATENVATTHVTVDESAHTGVGLITVAEDGENAITVAPGANETLTPAHVEAAQEAIAQADVLLTQLEIPRPPVRRALELAHDHGVEAVLNPAPARSLPDELLGLVDVLIPNETEAKRIAGYEPDATVDPETLVGAVHERGPEAVVLTRGGNGVLIEAETTTRLAAADVSVVDTTGAGDAFCGAFAAERSRGATLVDAAAYARTAAGQSCTAYEVIPALPTRDELED